MFASLARNVALTGVAYFIVSLIGLLLAPVLIAAYGVVGYGQIILARIFLPSTAFGFLDLGVGENSTRLVANARASGNWLGAAQGITVLCVISLAVSLTAAGAVALAADHIAGWLSIPSAQRHGFAGVLRVTAAMLPFLFLSLVAEGIIKGFERFGQLRSCEVASALTFGIAALILVDRGHDANAICMAFLAGVVLRAAMATLFAVGLCRESGLRLARYDRTTRREIFAWSRTMLSNKLLGVMQTQMASPLLGFLAGPAAVGLFDAIVRIPRFAKSIFSLTSSTVVPLAARLQAGGEAAAVSKLGLVGTLTAFVLFAPATVMAMAFARPIIHHWLGSAIEPHWVWLSLMLFVPLLGVSTSFGGSMLLARHDAVRRLNRLALIQVTLQIGLSLVLLPLVSPWSFVIGQVASVIAVYPFQIDLIRRDLGMGNGLFRWLLIIFVSSLGVSLLCRAAAPAPDLAELVLILTGVSVIWTVMLIALMIKPDERARLWQHIRSLAQNRNA
jgi:O-antigen/teichoic acid export membrane protein